MGSGDYALAFEIYRAIHADFPDNIECLRYLVHIWYSRGSF